MFTPIQIVLPATQIALALCLSPCYSVDVVRQKEICFVLDS